MICGVQGCPRCKVTLPVSVKAEPAGAAFAAGNRLSGCAQLPAATEIPAIANEHSTRFFMFYFVSILARALVFHGGKFKRISDSALPTHPAAFPFCFVGRLGSNSLPRGREIAFFELHPESNVVRER
jgi:hypothetical protein